MRVTEGDHKGRVGAIVGINDSRSDFTIEFGDGTDAQLRSEELEKLPD